MTMNTKRNSFFYIGASLTALMVGLLVLGFFWTPQDPWATDAAQKMQPPSPRHWLGTDNFGRDLFSRILGGMGTSFLIALGVVAIGCTAGILIGSLCGYYGGIADLILLRLCDTLTAIPSMLIALVIVSLLGSRVENIIWALGILFIPSFARVVRSEVARRRDLNYVKSARLMGASGLRIIVLHILPDTLPVVLSAVAIGFNNAIISEASMSYLGIGIQPTQLSLGQMLSDSQTYLRSAPWYALSVGGAMVLLILGFTLLGEGLQRDNRRI